MVEKGRPFADIFAGGGEMGARMRALDWTKTAVGPVEAWPQSLKIVVRIMLTSRYAMWMGWGPELTFFCNDAYLPTLGVKHEWALGASARAVWAEIWQDIGPRAESVLQSGEATWDEGLLLFLERHGFLEETYHTFSYSPVPDDRGGIGGMLCVVTEDTERTIGERRLRSLRELSAATASARTAEDACQHAVRSLAGNQRDLPFVLVYLLDGAGSAVRLVAQAGLERDSAISLERISASTDKRIAGTLAEVRASRAAVLVDDVAQRFGKVRCEPWPESIHSAMVLPLSSAGRDGRLTGFFVAGMSPRRPIDDGYRGFLGLVAGHVTGAIEGARAYEEERHRAEQLAELDRAKTAFFSNVSHEFRTPLTLMLGPLEDALGSAPSTLGGSSLQSVSRNARRLLKLVNALLDFSRIEAGRAEASYEPTDLALLTTDLASAFRAAIERAGLTFEVDCPPLAEPVHVDRDMWEKIVLNLLSNALKFTFAGSITVALRGVGEHVELTVRDTGTGIPESELPHLFKRFHRVQGARARTHEGSGIGLALVHELVRLHGGNVRVESTLDRGTSFTVALPRGAEHLPQERRGVVKTLVSTASGIAPFVDEARRWLPDEPRAPNAPNAPSAASGADDEAVVSSASAPLSLSGVPSSVEAGAPDANVHILLADDNADMREYVGRLLRARWTVEAVADGAAALVAARARRPDLVLTDVMMPNLDGFGLLRELRADPILRDVPIIMLSARAGEESRVEGLQAGADDYLVKPFSARELVARVGTHLQIAGLRAVAERERAAAENANRAKDEFLAMLGHELRNPLAPIVTALSLMRLRAHGAVERERTVIERQVEHLTRLVDDLLDVSRITGGKVELKRHPVEISEVVAKAIETASPLLEQRRHHLASTVPVQGLVVDGDVTRLAQVVGNLLTNAAKYTDHGGRITVRAERQGKEVVVEVGDNGIGIAPPVLPHVFDTFVQERREISRALGGLGLGLAIVRSLVTMHGGSVAAASPGKGLGSVFTIRLPLVSSDEVEEWRRSSAPPASSATVRGLRILIVDDNEDAADVLGEALTSLGHETRVAYDGPGALRAVESFTPEVGFLDIGLPVMDGHELARRLRDLPALARIQLIAVTGYGQDSDREKSRAAGFDRHLVKPVLLDQLAPILFGLGAAHSS